MPQSHRKLFIFHQIFHLFGQEWTDLITGSFVRTISNFFFIQVSFIFQNDIEIDLNKGTHNFAPPHVEVDFSIELFNINL